MVEKQNEVRIFKRTLQAFCLAAAMSFVFSGCNWPQRTVPGTIGSQRAEASVHDPFPSNELGPPIMGARPRGFERPLSEARALQSSPYARSNQRGAPANPGYGF